LTSLKAVHDLGNTEAAKGLPVSFEATVTYFNSARDDLFVQDGAIGIYIWKASAFQLEPGDRVLVKGVTAPSFRPYVSASAITVLGEGKTPKPVNATFDQLIRGQYDSVLVTLRGKIRSANSDVQSGANKGAGATLRVVTDGGIVETIVNRLGSEDIDSLLDAEVEITGVAGGSFDGKREQTGVALHVPSITSIKIVRRAAVSPWSLPETPIDRIMTAYHIEDRSSRLRVTGVVTYYEPGAAVVLQNGDRSAWISTRSSSPIRIGDRAEAIGFPSLSNGFLNLTSGEVRDSGTASPLSPSNVSLQQLSQSQHVFDLVAVEGVVAVSARESAQDAYVLAADGDEFPAFLRHPANTTPVSLPAFQDIPVGTRVRLTGICVPDNTNPLRHNVHFSILLRSADDIAVLSGPNWMDERHTMIIAGLLLTIVLVLGGRGWFLEYRVRREIGSLAYVEQRRGRILESINSSEPLAEILERVTELVSVRLNGAPCWCEIADGAALGNRPAHLDPSSMRTVEYPIAARSGPPLGSIFAAFDARIRPTTLEREALAMAAGLATLAVETSRLYADLVRRSEFDVLTDVQNRFAMERTLEAMIHNARQSAGIFAVIFIDLNDFKQVNDVHGHLVGDLFLQEVAQRMKRQLRPCDTLGRVGGDEFAVLVSEVRNRAEVDEISSRLEACFVEPFIGDGYVLNGSASIGVALYPEDATTADGLLSTADAAMYMVKFRKKGIRPDKSDSEFSQRNRA
jgi:diguanylate cyclase (GGDEF)-like protein